MTLGNRIGRFRRGLGLTQEALAQRLEVTNQAVSKWESDTCCPDISLLPKLAEIFGVTIDALFGREEAPKGADLPWEDDGVLRVVLYAGRTLVGGHPAAEKIEFCYEGPALNIHSAFSVTCGDVEGNVSAGGSVTCDDVEGNVHASGSVICDQIDGDVRAGGNVTCDCVDGNVNAGGNIQCDEINGGTVQAGGNVYCDHMEI